MRVYALSGEGRHFLGFENNGVMIDLSRAIACHEIIRENCARPPLEHIEELIIEGKCTLEYLETIMMSVEQYGLAKDLAVTGDYETEPPVYPGKIIALGENYLAHIQELGHKVPDEPVLFGKWPSCVIGNGAPILKPERVGRMDYEAELALIIGSEAWRVTKETAMEHVAGYTCLNDVTARDMQARDIARSLPWMPSKNFESAAPLGPCLLVRDAVSSPVSIGVQSRVNGELRQNGNTSDFIFDIPTVIAYISHIMRLEPGDVITTGTPMGVGPIEPGDIVEITCSGIGTLANPVVALDETEQ
jgi:2-keto-4-pentenoate hydratase/2-oxohepta-3-ene-1,7-dioic acid hydratase in catechol pathway